MLKKFKLFHRSEEGAVTVDWVVLTAAIVALAALIIITINNGATSVGEGTGTYLGARQAGQ